MQRKRLIITIDGPAGSGKSTTARLVSERLGLLYLDTGAMYRAITLAVLRRGYGKTDKKRIKSMLLEIKLDIQASGNRINVLLDGENVSDEIRSPEIDKEVSWVSQIPEVRDCLMAWQREVAENGGVIAEGRDMGSVVFPAADLKFYLVADLTSRARRRWMELKQRGVSKSLESVVEEIATRDEIDSSRRLSPLVKPRDAIEIDTSNLTIEEQVDLMVARIQDYPGE